MRSLPEAVRSTRAVAPRSIASSVAPFLGAPAGPAGQRRLEDAAITLLAAVYPQAGLVLEALLAERLGFECLLHAVHRCRASRGGTE
ncbi:MAG: hypothetical protein ACYDAN_08380 [Candidatus Limnocylindrales bacterium]